MKHWVVLPDPHISLCPGVDLDSRGRVRGCAPPLKSQQQPPKFLASPQKSLAPPKNFLLLKYVKIIIFQVFNIPQMSAPPEIFAPPKISAIDPPVDDT